LHGIPAMRYQGEKIGVVEAEGRWNILERWAIFCFFGAGKVGGDDPSFDTEDNILSGGVGGRYLFLKDQNLWLGIDVARGPEDTYWYVIIGQAW